MKILVRAPNWIGDQILAFPFFYYLRKAYPNAQITVAGVEWVRGIQFQTCVDEVHVLRTDAKASAYQKFKNLNFEASLLKKKGPFDLAISLPNSFSSAWLLYRSGARRRRGYDFEGRGILLNEKLKWESSANGASGMIHRAQAYVDLLPPEAAPKRPVQEFWGVYPENELDPGVPGELPYFDPIKYWPFAEVEKPPVEPYWVLAPGATADSRRWFSDRFRALASRIAAETGWKGLIVGGPGETALAQELCADSSLKMVDFTARGGVSGLWPVFRKAQFTVTNESGLAHVASLCGSFVQIICGAADPRRTRPLGPGKVQVAINPVECWPCERNTCFQMGEKKLQCLRGIDVDTVWSEIQRGLEAERARRLFSRSST